MKRFTLFATYFFGIGFLTIVYVGSASEKSGMKEALERGFAIQARRTQAITNDGDFELTRNEGGFSLTPKEFTGHENEHRFSLHFGKAPPDPEE